MDRFPKIGKVVGVHDVINHSKFGFNIFRGLNFRFPTDFAGHRYNSAAATAQPVMTAAQAAKNDHLTRQKSVNERR